MGLYPVALSWNARQGNIIQYNTIQYKTIQYSTKQYNTIQNDTIRYNTIQYNTIHTIQNDAIQYSTIQYSTVQYKTIQYNTVQNNTIQYRTIRYDTIQYNTIQNDKIQYNTIIRITQNNIQHSTEPFIWKNTKNINKNTLYTSKTQQKVKPKVDESILKTIRYTKQRVNHTIQYSVTHISPRPTLHSTSFPLYTRHLTQP